MKTGQTYPSGSFQPNKSSMIIGAGLLGAAGLIGFIGMIVSGTAMASACRQWFQELDMTPTEAARHKWNQTKAASAAGAAAWQHHDGGRRTHV